MSYVYAFLQYIFSIWKQSLVNKSIIVCRICGCDNRFKSEIL